MIFMKKIILLSVIISQAFYLNAQINVCDSVSYTIGGAQTFTITLNTPGLTNIIDSMEVTWEVCNTSQCYTTSGTIFSSLNILQTDTVKACYDAYIYIDTMTYFCHVCDSLLYIGGSWELLISGCMDSLGCNYDPSATFSVSCAPFGCLDSTACNYDPNALCDDGSCAGLSGCMDTAAINYDPAATCDDGNCQYITEIADLYPLLISEFYPNPAKEIAYFDYYFNKSEKLIIMDILGNEVKTIKLSVKGRQKVNISDLSKGIYFGNIIINNEVVIVKKLIVK
jgi:hypothetical protein